MSHTFTALRITENADKTFTRQLVTRNTDELPAGDVLIKVVYSSLNYKDALSATGHKGVTRNYPHTPGIDAAGHVAESNDSRFAIGDAVFVTGYDLGMNTAGGFAGYIRVPADWVVKLPSGLTLQESMIYGTAGFTAALSVYKLQHAGLKPEKGEVLVTGATGGVGSIGVALLAKLGYQVIAGTGKSSAHDFLKQLGATGFLSREELVDMSSRPLLKGRWAGVLDTVGGDILVTALKSTKYWGHVSCCGLVASPTLNASVYPFILRGVDLLGVDSVECPMDARLILWQRMASDWKIDLAPLMTTECSLAELNDVYIDKILQGQALGRIVVKI
ncbi:YhdH/YhfP family quinone oxidoreductase [Beggiatoa leptomitoformis]|uniref:Acryloyl-CoA reductase n=1 Tax=Beggiatoa leptomitoformis TaxID=288004 RepID=A0A2N9YEU3_9GAMM|nr:YhdH/YhfP family quinone oxidoreductase [Beggiatoa leptomitoformis]ALG68643.1 acryloyl-CoA reductase [Beggiatoa leptomitoformis]AUI69008.1 acryloyl-CoA reductase [Beggiatoa leptomitoformis]